MTNSFAAETIAWMLCSLALGCGGEAVGSAEPLRPDTTDTFRSYVTMPEGCITVRAEQGGYVLSDYGYVTDCNAGGDVALYCPEGTMCLYSANSTCDCLDHRWDKELLIRGQP